MKSYFFILLFLFSCCKNKSKIIGSDKEIALNLAEKVWKEAYGQSEINGQKPFVAEKKNDSIWIVSGTQPKPMIGGVAYAEVNVKTQKVITYTHGE